MSHDLSDEHMNRLRSLGLALIDQASAHILVKPNRASAGFWFGGGNVVEDEDGTLWLCGRYRNYGDSRTGLAAGERGLECALFASRDRGVSFSKVARWSKADLSYPGAEVLSIEGTSLHRCADGAWELFISTEKVRPYPDEVKTYLKPGTGVWSIDVIRGKTPAELDVSSIAPVLEERDDPAYIHVKDPAVYTAADGATEMIFCSHPYCWSSANSSLARREVGTDQFHVASWQMVERGPAWDVAGTRATARLTVPRLGEFAQLPPVSLLFYDGLECVRQHDEDRNAVSRPRGYSCEEISGMMAGLSDGFPGTLERVSRLAPLFISPWGTGCSRYVDVATLKDGLFASWQQSQADGSQCLVGHFLSFDAVARLLA